MDGIDEQAILIKYKDAQAPLYPVVAGGIVVGQEVTASNQLVYVIRDEQGLRLALAIDTKIIPKIHETEGAQTTVIVKKQ